MEETDVLFNDVFLGSHQEDVHVRFLAFLLQLFFSGVENLKIQVDVINVKGDVLFCFTLDTLFQLPFSFSGNGYLFYND